MVRVAKIDTSNYTRPTSEQKAKRQETAQEVAIGTGVTGAASYQAKRYATKQTLNTWLSRVTEASKAAHRGTREVTGFWGKFKYDISKFSSSIMSRAGKYQNWKIIGPLVKSPLMKGTARFFGIGMAFFALVTGVEKAYRNGQLAVNDIKEKLLLAA